MTAQAVAKEMIRWNRGGSIILIGSMSGTVANKVTLSIHLPPRIQAPSDNFARIGSHLSSLQR